MDFMRDGMGFPSSPDLSGFVPGDTLGFRTFHNSAAEQASGGFSWDFLRSVLEGKSPIDLKSLSLKDRESAQRFLLHYGYNLNKPEERQIVEDLHGEAVHFIKQYFCPANSEHPTALSMPPEIERVNDCRDLLVWASSGGSTGLTRQVWSCAVLRVMHTLNHLLHTMRVGFFAEIRRQILDKIRQNIHMHGDQPVLGRGPLAVELKAIYYKEEKSRDSLVMKLLHKTKNVAEKVHDRLGVKLVTATKFDALRVLRCLDFHNILVFANLTPGRSRNTLLNLDAFRSLYQSVQEDESFRKASKELNPEERERLIMDMMSSPRYAEQLREAEQSQVYEGHNAFSSSDYQSIQFTVQQLVTLENPGYLRSRRLRVQLAKYHMGPDMEGLLDELEGSEDEHTLRLLFPLEVQIIDQDNYQKSIVGAASHDEYKRRQQDAARNRVMQQIYELADEG